MSVNAQRAPQEERPRAHPNCAAIGARAGVAVGALYALAYGLVGSLLNAAASGGGMGLRATLALALGLTGIALVPAMLVGGVGGAFTGPLVCLVLRRYPPKSPSRAWLVGLAVCLGVFSLVLLPLAVTLATDANPRYALRTAWPLILVFVLGPGAFYIAAGALLTHYFYPRYFR